VSIPVLGEKYVYRALDHFPGTSVARIVLQPGKEHKSDLKTIRLSIEKDDSDFGVQHQFLTGWAGIARVGSNRHCLNIKITTYHQTHSQRQQHLISDPRSTEFCWNPEYKKQARFYPAFRAHHEAFRYMLSTSHENLKSLAYRSCAIAFEASDGDPNCQPLHSIEYQVFAHSTGDSAEEQRAEFLRVTGPGLAISMDRHQYMHFRSTKERKFSRVSEKRRAYVALGSNMGDRTTMIERACHAMSQRDIQVLRTSSLYETEPKYVEDQRPFINGVCEASALPSLQLSLENENLLLLVVGR